MQNQYLHADITKRIIKCFYNVYNALGYGFNEAVYQGAMAIECRCAELEVASQVPIRVHYLDEVVGQYRADLIIEETVIVELKAARGLAPEHTAQLLNYLKATRHEVGLLLNFGAEPTVVRRVFNNERKGSLGWAS